MSHKSDPNIWPQHWLDTLSDTALERASSAAIFKRGVTYAYAGAIHVVSETPMPEPALHAQISGTEVYDTEVWIENDALAGSCDCLSAAEGWFCKHQVALALVWRARLGGSAPEVDETARKKVAASAKRAQTIKDKRQSLSDFLLGQDAHTLAAKLLELADHDRELARDLYHWQKVSTHRDDPAEIKSLITELLASGGFIEYRATRDYVRRAEAVLPVLEKAIETDAATGLKLAMHALDRCWRAIQQADDSNGEIGGLCQAVGEVFVTALFAAGAQPERFGKTYLGLLLDDPFGCFDEHAAEAAMGAKALDHFRQLLAQQWRVAKDAVRAIRSAGGRRASYYTASGDSDYALLRLERLHIRQLVAMGDMEAAIAIFSEDLHDVMDHNRLIYFLEEHDCHREAFVAAERANKAFPNNDLLEVRLLTCYQRDGWHQEALALQRARFERGPSLKAYRDVLQAAAQAKEHVPTQRQALLDWLQRIEEAAFNDPSARRFANVAGQPGPHVTLRVEIFCAEGLWLEALALVQPPALCDAQVLKILALRLPDSHKDEAVKLLHRIFNTVMPHASNPYAEALQVATEIAKRLEPAQRSEWLASLRTLYKTKRNFVRDLPSA